MRAILINPFESTVSEVTIPTHKDNSFKLEVLYELLKCEYIEMVRVSKDQYLIIDDSGRLIPNEYFYFQTEKWEIEIAWIAILTNVKQDWSNVDCTMSVEEVKKLVNY